MKAEMREKCKWNAVTGEQELRWQVREGGRKEGVSHEEKDFHKKKGRKCPQQNKKREIYNKVRNSVYIQ